MNKPKLIPCPFCGKVETVEYTNAGECGACAKASLDNTCCDYEPAGCSMVAVVCSVNRGGCGASSGYASGYKEAARKWNKRAFPTLYDSENDYCYAHFERRVKDDEN